MTTAAPAESSAISGLGSQQALVDLLASRIVSQAGRSFSGGLLGQLGKKPLVFHSLDELDLRVASLFEFLGSVQGFSKKTVVGLRTDYRSFRRFVGEASLETTFLCGESDAQVRVIEAYIAHLRTSGKAHDTVATYFRGLHSIFEWLGKRLGTFNPFVLVKRPSGSPSLPKAIPPESMERLVSILLNRQTETALERLRDLAVVALLGFAGLRRGEVLTLEVEDIDVRTGDILVRRGKGKHGGRDRYAHLTTQGRDIVQAYAEERKRLRRSHPEFITSLAGDRPIGEVTIRRIFRRIDSWMHGHLTPHMLRHTFATLLDKYGVSSHVRMLALGHQNLEVLQRYTHTFAGDAGREIDRVVLNVDTRRLGRLVPSLTQPEPRHTAPPVVVEDAEVARGGDEARVASEALDDVQGHVAADHHGDERVAQGVDAEGDPGGSPDSAHDPDEGGLGHHRPATAPSEEAGDDDAGASPLPQISLQEGAKLGADVGHPVFPAPLALPPAHEDGLLGEVYIGEGEVQEFTLPNAAVDERPEDGDGPGPVE